MSSIVSRAIAVLVLAGLHFAASCAFVVVAFVGAFGAPQGGDAGYTIHHKELHDAFLKVLEVIGWIFGFPAAILTKAGLPLIAAAIINSLLYGLLFVWLGGKIIRRITRSNHSVDSTHYARESR